MAISGPRTTITPSSHDSILQRVLDPFVVDPRKIVLDLLVQPLVSLSTFLVPAVVVERHNVTQATNFPYFTLVGVANLNQHLARRCRLQAAEHVNPLLLELLQRVVVP